MGRHKPTRHSLRHSRMIVTSKHFQGKNEILLKNEPEKIFSGNFLLSHRLQLNKLIRNINSSFIVKCFKHSIRMAGAVCSHPESRRGNQSRDARRMDLFICKLNTNSTESILERIDTYSFGASRSLPVDLQKKQPFKAQSKLFLVPQGENNLKSFSHVFCNWNFF